jgi:hypothetical protein
MKRYNIFKLDFSNKSLTVIRQYLSHEDELKRHLQGEILNDKSREDFEIRTIGPDIFVTGAENSIAYAAAKNFSPESIELLKMYVED